MKKKVFWVGNVIFNMMLISVILTKTVYAYIDPSAVTYVIQAVAAVVVAIGACLTIFRHKIAAFFKKNKNQNNKKEVHFVEDNTENDSVDLSEGK